MLNSARNKPIGKRKLTGKPTRKPTGKPTGRIVLQGNQLDNDHPVPPLILSNAHGRNCHQQTLELEPWTAKVHHWIQRSECNIWVCLFLEWETEGKTNLFVGASAFLRQTHVEESPYTAEPTEGPHLGAHGANNRSMGQCQSCHATRAPHAQHHGSTSHSTIWVILVKIPPIISGV